MTISVKSGESLLVTITAKDDGAIKDLTGYTLDSHVRLTSGDVIALSLTTNITLPTNGVFTLSATAAEITALGVGDYKYDVRMTNGADVDISPTATFKVIEAITHD